MTTPPAPPPPAPPAGPGLLVGVERHSRRPRRAAPDAEVHAVPRLDRTRTALCGASVSVVGTSFSASDAHACPDCADGAASGRGRAARPLLAKAG